MINKYLEIVLQISFFIDNIGYICYYFVEESDYET